MKIRKIENKEEKEPEKIEDRIDVRDFVLEEFRERMREDSVIED